MRFHQLHANADARRILQAHGLRVRRVVGVDVDSVLFIDTDGQAQTAWIYREPETGKVTVVAQPGFRVDPPWDFSVPG